MASSAIITIKSEKTGSQLAYDIRKGSDKDREGLSALQNLLKAIAGGQHRAIIDVQTSSSAPVAASGTWTLASVVDTDAVSLAGVTLTFKSSPATEDDIEVDVGSAKAFASATDLDLTTGYITESSHGYLTGDVGQMTTSSALPTGLALSTDYHVIKIDANTYALASSQDNAVAGVPIKPSALGTGNQTFTPVSDKCLAYRLAAAVNAHSVLSTIVSASAALAVVTVSCLQKGVIGNYIAFSDADSTITSSGSGYLANGAGGAQNAAHIYTLGL